MRASLVIIVTVLLLTGMVPAVSAGTIPELHAITAGGDLILEGENIRVLGNVHANRRVILRGSVVVEGSVEAGEDVVIEGGARAGEVRQQGRRVTLPIVDFAALRRYATLVISGDTRLPSLAWVYGTIYIAGSLIANHPSGSGALVAEGDITTVAGLGRPSGIDVDLVSRRRISLHASRVGISGLIGLQGVDVEGSDLIFGRPIIGGDVRIHGTDIKVLNGPPAFPPPLPSVWPPPTIHAPMEGTTISGSVQVIGSAEPNVRVRIALCSTGPHMMGCLAEDKITTDSSGRFSHSLTIVVRRWPGTHFLIAEVIGSAEVIGPVARLSPVVAIPIRVSLSPRSQSLSFP